jgi:hypothetical protein
MGLGQGLFGKLDAVPGTARVALAGNKLPRGAVILVQLPFFVAQRPSRLESLSSLIQLPSLGVLRLQVQLLEDLQ